MYENTVYSRTNLIINDKIVNYPSNLQEFYNKNITLKVQ